MRSVVYAAHGEPWNRGKIVGQKVPFKVRPPDPAIRRGLRCCLAEGQTIAPNSQTRQVVLATASNPQPLARASLALALGRAGQPRDLVARPRRAVTSAALNVTSQEKYSHRRKTGNVANAP